MKRTIFFVLFVIGFGAAGLLWKQSKFINLASNNKESNLVPLLPPQSTSPPQITMHSGSSSIPRFGFANMDGSEILLLGDRPENPNDISFIIFDSIELEEIKFVRDQVESSDSSGRDIASNFNNSQGAVYKILSRTKVKPNGTYILCSKSYIQTRRILSIQNHPKNVLSDKWISTLEHEKKMKIGKSWNLATFSENHSVFWVRFNDTETKGLISMVLISNDQISTIDFPADPKTGWRVGDDEMASGDLVNILFACNTPEGLEFVYEWLGEESNHLAIIKQNGGSLIEEECSSSARYHAP